MSRNGLKEYLLIIHTFSLTIPLHVASDMRMGNGYMYCSTVACIVMVAGMGQAHLKMLKYKHKHFIN